MEENFYNDGFEDFLQKQVKDHRMYPSDGVWRNIYKSLHGDNNWPALTIAAFVFLAAVIAVSVYFSPSPDIFAVPVQTPVSTNTLGKNNVAGSISNAITKTNNKPVNNYPNSTKELDIIIDDPQQSLVSKPVDFAKNDDNLLSLNETTSFKEIKVTAPADNMLNAGLPNDDIVSKDDIGNSSAGKQLFYETPVINERDLNATAKNFVIENKINPIETSFTKPILINQNNKSLKGKFGYVVYITPSSTYRKLIEKQAGSAISTAGPVGLNYIESVNKVVRHKPGTGIEAGVAFMYNLSNRLKIKTGFQFNVRQYSIEAYNSPAEIATINLYSIAGTESINTFTPYRSSNGYGTTELINRYYEVSVPLGFEFHVAGERNIQFNVAASVQPTYIMNRNAYLISNDYKNYSVNPGIMRNWNVNSNIEAFISIKSGDYKWQIGPQFRYQNLPTFIKAYPIHEHLTDYGIKLGVTKHIP